MEPASIDWKNVHSRFVHDDLFENFNAPKWVDLSSPPAVDDSCLCRPDCKHPTTHEDFLHKPTPSPDPKERKVLGERNTNPNPVKRRGVLQPSMAKTPLLTPPRAKPTTAAKKKARGEDLENQNPNLPPPSSVPSTPLKVASKIAKEAVKSSAEKSVREMEAEATESPQRSLKSTRSSRNLFAGKEILTHISEFCGEVRRMVTSRRDKGGILDEEKQESGTVHLRCEEEASEKNEKKGNGNGDTNTGEHLRLLQQEVRSCPPTPQRFPSPMAFHKQGGRAAAARKPPRAASPERPILKELILNEEGEVTGGERKRGSCSSGGNRALDMFWFLKPCYYLA